MAQISWAGALVGGVREDVGYITLLDELGVGAPTGAGVPVMLVEAPDDLGGYQPQVNYPDFQNKAFTFRSVAAGTSAHATLVGQNFFGLTGSIAPGISQIEVYEANDFINTGFMHTGSAAQNPKVSQQASRVGSHSWIASAGSNNFTIDHLARMDWLVDQDDFTQVVGVNNGPNGSNPIYSNSFNSIAVGVTNGNHALGTLAIGGLYTSGRTRPELVAPQAATSYATPIVSAASALLIQTAHDTPALSNGSYTLARQPTQTIYHAETSEVVKAALLAGASRMAFNADGSSITNYRGAIAQQTTNGLDSRFGAGQVNAYNSYHIVAAGEQDSLQEGAPSSVFDAGFDYDPSFGGASGSNNTASYEFTAGWTGQTLSASLVWNAKVDIDQLRTMANKASAITLHDLNLSLFDISDAGAPQLVASSTGSGQNTENIWTTLVDGRRYRMQVSSSGTPFDWDYGLAWTTTSTIGWSGALGGIWKHNDAAEANWIKGSAPAGFLNGEHVVFNDTATGYTVEIAGNVAPGSILVDNAAQDYSFSGGPIVGATGLVKRGAGILQVNNLNSYTGETIVQDGIVRLGLSNGLNPLASLVVTGPGHFDLTGHNQSFDRISGDGRISVGAGTLTIGAAGGTSVFGGSVDGNGEIIKAGAGSTTFGSGHAFAGRITVRDGYLAIASNDSLGSAAGETVVANGGALVFAGPVNYSTAETIVVNGAGKAGFGALENQVGGNTFAGTITLGSDASIGLTAGTLQHTGTLHLPAGTTLTKTGAGLMTVRGNLALGANSAVSVTNGTMTLTPNFSSVISLSSDSPTLRISGNGVARISASVKNPLADTIDPTRRMNVANQAAGGFAIEGGIAALGSLTGSGGTIVNSSGHLSATHIRQSSLTLSAAASRATVRLDGTALGTSVLSQLSMASGAIFDLNDNVLIVRATAATKDAVHADLEAKIVTAQNGLDGIFVTRWDGPGITSGAARTANLATGFDLVGLGVIRNSDLDITTGLPGSNYSAFGGQTVTPDDVLIKYTYIGDGNLDGVVSFDDYVGMDNAFFELIPNLGWATGDINFDNLINFDDYSVVDQAFFFQGVSLGGESGASVFFQAASGGIVVAVPEPASTALIGLAVAALVGCAYRRRSIVRSMRSDF